MTSRQLLWTCVVISLCLHWFLVQQRWDRHDPAPTGETIVIPASFDIAVSGSTNGLALEQGMAPEKGETDHEDAARRFRRQALQRFLAQVREAVEHCRFQSGNGDLSDLIGNVRYRFRIRRDDTFTDIRLEHSSGDARLDQAARKAVESASGVVKRPNILKGQTWSLSITVKYQYKL